MSKRDYYDILGVSRDASDDDLKKAYRKLAKELHPDRNKDDPTVESRFKEVNEAYDVLKDRQKRSAYDQFGHAAFSEGGGGGAGGFRPSGGGADFSSAFSDIFDDLFGGEFGGRRGGAGARTRGSDLRYNLTINLEDAFHGKAEQITAPGAVSCEACTGTGSAGGAAPSVCPTCSGMGKVRAQQGFFTIERSCPTCGGRGQIIKNPCSSCNGAGLVQKDRSLNVQIPKGVEDGTRIRLAGEGEPGVRGGTPGDLYIFVSIKPHPLFKRDGADLFCEVPVPFIEAAVGGSVEVPTIDGGKTRVAIPAGTQSGKQLRLRGKGMPTLRGGRTGDLYLEILVETPINLTSKQKDLLRAFSKDAGSKQNPNVAEFEKKAQSFWTEAKTS
ncbi:MAG: molecular chaperone DnaJ [Neomegalonema sp.]|nr:molecular chaperone DnaJ [Neomegalonema sp.]